MSQSHRIKGGASDEAFQEQCFLWERGASVGADFDLLNFQDLLQAQERIYVYSTLTEREIFLFKTFA